MGSKLNLSVRLGTGGRPRCLGLTQGGALVCRFHVLLLVLASLVELPCCEQKQSAGHFEHDANDCCEVLDLGVVLQEADAVRAGLGGVNHAELVQGKAKYQGSREAPRDPEDHRVEGQGQGPLLELRGPQQDLGSRNVVQKGEDHVEKEEAKETNEAICARLGLQAGLHRNVHQILGRHQHP